MRIFFSAIFSLLLLTVNAQQKEPVQFKFESKRLTDSTAELLIKAIIQPDFKLIATEDVGETGIVSSLEIDTSGGIRLLGTLTAKEDLQKTDDPELGSFGFFQNEVNFTQTVLLPATAKTIEGNFNWLAKSGSHFPSGAEAFDVQVEDVSTPNTTVSELSVTDKKDDSLFTIFFICLAAGLLAVITPCVFPLVPVTVSFFLKKSKTRSEGVSNAFWYSLSIILIYTIPTLIITIIFGEKALYNISTHPAFNFFFFAIFILFGISLLGAFEIQLPNSWANKADQKAGKGGWIGIFFMALTLVIVSFSCTGPIVGTLLGQTSNQGIGLAPVTGMLGFSFGLALPFALFALFPSMLKSLPKSGGWLNTVKVVFGFIELALALKFLSNIDLMYHWRLLDRNIFLTLWIVIFGLLGLYLLGKLKFSHDSDVPFISIPKLFFAIASFSFALYMVPGLFGAPLNALSGLIPPVTTQSWPTTESVGTSAGTHILNDDRPAPKKHADILSVPYGLTAYFDLEEGMAAARTLKKPVMLDFTGHSCANCRKMEDYVWRDPRVLSRLKNDFVLISLYVDEPRKLPVDEQYTNAAGEKIKTVGAKNLDYEIHKFGFNAQPLYMFLDLNESPLSNIKYGYDADVEKFIAHLDAVSEEYKKRTSR